METIQEGKRWSGAEWAGVKKQISVVGQGGIGSWLTLCLSRIEHNVFGVDPDVVDATNVQGGQMFKNSDVGSYKVDAVNRTCRDFGCTNRHYPVPEHFTEHTGCTSIVMTGLDNMEARKMVFSVWKEMLERESDRKNTFLLIDGRLNLEDYEILCVQGNKPEQIEKYERDFLFSDDEVATADCTVKQSTHTAMGIASWMTALLCNWLANEKLGMDFREVPFHTRIYYPGMIINLKEAELVVEEEALAV